MGYRIKKTGKYNYSITVPKWLALQFQDKELFWTDNNNSSVTLSTEDTDVKEKTRKHKGWSLVLNKANPYLSNGKVTFGYNSTENNFYFFCQAQAIFKTAVDLDTLLESLNDYDLPTIPENLKNEFWQYVLTLS